MVIDYTRRLAIEKSLVMGMALQVPLDKVQGSWLGLMTILLACMNMIILLADLCWSMLQAKELKWEELSAELVARVAPLLFYMVNLRHRAVAQDQLVSHPGVYAKSLQRETTV